jgi:predicted AlkP superfamily pyrophosphatase or phosphodiesterase
MPLLEPLRRALAFGESLMMDGNLFVEKKPLEKPGDYARRLNRQGACDNDARQSLPQTAIFGIVTEHFRQKRADGRAPKALIVVHDGARADLLGRLEGMEDSGVNALRAEGGRLYHMYTGGSMYFCRQKTSTNPAFATIVTGKWVAEKDGTGHGVTQNGVRKPVEPKSFFTVLLEEGLAEQTVFAASWGGHFKSGDAHLAAEREALAEKGLNARWAFAENDAETLARALEEIRDPGAGLVMVSLEHCDHAGHSKGYGNHIPAYVESIRTSERDAYKLIQAVKERPAYDEEDWLLIVTSDHGGNGTWHDTYMVARQVFFATNKPLSTGG